MGTNYYFHDKRTLHIGKSSGGWCFSLHVIPEDGINTLEDWQAIWNKQGIIRNEYGERISISDMENIITKRSWAAKNQESEQWYRENNAEPGPHNLARSKVGLHCIGHGPGVWDYITGEFS